MLLFFQHMVLSVKTNWVKNGKMVKAYNEYCLKGGMYAKILGHYITGRKKQPKIHP
jgi:hypothetical protein